jgi:hypothetical protein
LACAGAALRGPEYDELVDEFITTARDVFPGGDAHWQNLRAAAGE